MKNNILFITPHMSTGGLPQVLLNKIKLLKDTYNIVCIEWDFISWEYVVQRNKLIDILKNNFYSLGENKEYELFNIIEDFKPDIIWIEEFPEYFIPEYISEKIYNTNRKYKIIETTHTSYAKVSDKKFMPDKFVFASVYSAINFKSLNIPYSVVEYPIDKKHRNREECQKKLNFDYNWKHVVNIGLFTPGKNQKYAFELCDKLKDYKIKFHFVGNQAPNFEDYWSPLMKNKPDNCIIWGERNDTDTFIQASDLFLFTSNLELNPLVIKEVLSYDDIKIMMFNLNTYCNKYDENKRCIMLTGDVDIDSNKLLSVLYPERSLFKTPNIKLVHLLLDLDYRADISVKNWQSNIDRQIKSVNCFKTVANKFSSYTQLYSNVNRQLLPKESSMYPEIVKESLENSEPPHLSYGHYGAYLAHKRGIVQEFNDEVDALIIIESDVTFSVSPEEFQKTILEAYEMGIKYDASFVTFAGYKNYYGLFEDYNSLIIDINDRWVKVPHFVLGSMYMVFRKEKENIKKIYNYSGWHSPDIWLAENYHNKSTILALKNPLVIQETGFSLIDYKVKDTHGNYLE